MLRYKIYLLIFTDDVYLRYYRISRVKMTQIPRVDRNTTGPTWGTSLFLLWLIKPCAKSRCVLEMTGSQAQKILTSITSRNFFFPYVESREQHSSRDSIEKQPCREVCFSICLVKAVNKCLSFQYGSQLPRSKIMSQSISDQVKRDAEKKIKHRERPLIQQDSTGHYFRLTNQLRPPVSHPPWLLPMLCQT